MNINWLFFPTLGLTLVLFFVGQIGIRKCRTTKETIAFSVLCILFGIPGVLMAAYYLHWFDNAKWFYEFRAIPFIELTAAGSGLFVGVLAEQCKGSTLFSKPILLVILLLGIAVPHLKPVLAPLPADHFSNVWKDNVCMQSTPTSCGAASAATLFRYVGESLTEQEIAHECFTYQGGTENWYIARAFRRRGIPVRYRIENRFPVDLQMPALAGVRLGGAGHFITILDKQNSMIVVGDPLVGRREIPASKITQIYRFTGFFLEIWDRK